VIRELGESESRGLCELLISCVEGGASVGFMLPMTLEKAQRFWQGVAAAAARGERLIVLAEDTAGNIIGTAQVVLSMPENQPHRGDLAKMLVRPASRRQGVAAVLLLLAMVLGLYSMRR
jgi:GNAT superfamily N-acetyltransferase